MARARAIEGNQEGDKGTVSASADAAENNWRNNLSIPALYDSILIEIVCKGASCNLCKRCLAFLDGHHPGQRSVQRLSVQYAFSLGFDVCGASQE